MSFRLTYSTMFDPPPELHTSFDAAIARTTAQLGGGHLLHIGGRDRTGARALTTRNPADQDQVLGEFATAVVDDAHEALLAAHEAWQSWRQTSLATRLKLLRRAGELIEQRVYDIAAALTLEVGKNRMEAIGEAQETADFFYAYCDEMEKQAGFDKALPDDPLPGYASHNRSVLKPYGAWVVIAPFNFPFALAGGPVAAALVTGNTVVLKGSPATPWAGRLLADCLRDAGLPAGAFNYLGAADGEVGQALLQHSLTAGVTFTGSYQVGMSIARTMLAGRHPRPCIAEMGGKNACIVTASADLERAAAGIVRSAFGMSGQKCSALSRLYVHQDVADELIQRIVAATSALRIGNPIQRDVWLGPVATQAGYDNYAQYASLLGSQGADILVGGQRLRDDHFGRGFFVQPMLAQAPAAHPLWQQEMFLPIVMLQRVQSNQQAMQLANDTPLGLTAGIYGSQQEVSWFHQHIEAGVTYANRPQGATTGAWPGYQPFGGWKGSGNTGKAIASFYYLPQYLREQSQTVVE